MYSFLSVELASNVPIPYEYLQIQNDSYWSPEKEVLVELESRKSHQRNTCLSIQIKYKASALIMC